MAEMSKIAWTEGTFNPWWGCTHVNEACINCYAERDSKRYGFNLWGKGEERRFFGDKHWNEPLKWNKKAVESGVRKKVFCASMADVFEDFEGADVQRKRLWELIRQTKGGIDWLLLTKRPENIKRFLPEAWLNIPFPNVWLGCSPTHQKAADAMIPYLVEVPAQVRFLSCEPLLGAMDLSKWIDELDWVLCGGESGFKSRSMPVDAAISLAEQCTEARVPFFMKQLSQVDEKDYHNIEKFPLPLQRREFPR